MYNNKYIVTMTPINMYNECIQKDIYIDRYRALSNYIKRL